jgi:hypothetical protein
VVLRASDPSRVFAMELPSTEVAASLDPHMRLLLVELDKRFAKMDAKWEDRFSAVERRLDANDAGFAATVSEISADVYNQLSHLEAATTERAADYEAATATRVGTLESAAATFETWRPRIESSINAMATELVKMNSADKTNHTPATDNGGWKETTATHRPPGAHADGPRGGRAATSPPELGVGPASYNKGMHRSASTRLPFHGSSPQDTFGGQSHRSSGVGSLGNLPKMQFPLFDGENPKLWQSRCEDYFLMYNVDQTLWIKIASMNFNGAAARCLQSVESKLAQSSWS